VTGKANAYVRIMSIPSQEELDNIVSQTLMSMTRPEMEATLTEAFTMRMGMSEDDLKNDELFQPSIAL